ncbi:MAG: flagellar export protein FliJ [Rhodospirillales bacterium]|nr:flagellar export protein FliJ [Rhodospirillales bacterium]
MAKDLHSLIRLVKSRVDERQRDLAGLLRQVGELETRKVELEHQLALERASVRNQPVIAGFTYGAYVCEAITHRDRLDANIAELEDKIDAARDGLSTAYRELRTLETAQEQRDKQRAAEAARLEQANLDEIGLGIHARGLL